MTTVALVAWLFVLSSQVAAAEAPKPILFEPFVWPGGIPADCPFPRSTEISHLRFLGRCSNYKLADTWFPSWAEDGNLYSPFTDGSVEGDRSSSDSVWKNQGKENASTGQAVMMGDNPLNLTIRSLGLERASPGLHYGGRYPSGSLVHNGVWYYGTYCLGPLARTEHAGVAYNWPVLGPMPGFRISRDLGRTWQPSPHTPERPLFPEPVVPEGPVKIGAPHFVDFGRNMEHSPDGKAYLVAHGSTRTSPPARYAHNSWITGDQVYLLRVTPTPATINDLAAYEFFAGYDAKREPVWSRRFEDLRPLLEWKDRMGCVTITYNPVLKKFMMWVTDGWPTCFRMSSYLLEADRLTGPWRVAVYLKDFGEQAYFLNFPSKFIGAGGRRLWLCYSGNFRLNWNGQTVAVNPPGTRYGLVLQEVELLWSQPDHSNQPDKLNE